MKKGLAIFIVIILAVGLFVFFGKMTGNSVSAQKVTLYKSPTCGCCTQYAPYLKDSGFEVDIKMIENMKTIKEKYGIPVDMESCHTAIYGDYFVEGHVPLKAIEKLLTEQPAIDGIALPNMPAGSPGMPGTKSYPWIIYAINNSEVSEFMEI